MVAYLLDHGADINQQDSSKDYTALYLACKNGYLDVVELLVERGANGAISNRFGRTPLMVSSSRRRESIVALLLEEETALTTLDWQDGHGKTAVFRASARGYTSIVQLLVTAGADATLPTKEGTTPLAVAIAMVGEDYKECACLLQVGRC